MGIKKQHLKSKPVCKVTFRIPKEEANGVKSVRVVGDFNNWDDKATPMKSLKNGAFTATIEVEPNQEYHFKYIMDETKWENDRNADKYIPSPIGNWDNSVVVT
ncbi:MAG: isoamylase early set domain-containing protein [Deltaproteobacteria bacterium]|nr:isoamylase early set domain-containing protein [Deltaproteobacteria bacterium]